MGDLRNLIADPQNESADYLIKTTLMQHPLSAKLQPPEFLDRLTQRLIFFYVWVHGMLFEVHLLGKCKNFLCPGAWNHGNAVRIGDNDIASLDRHSITCNWNIGSSEAIVIHRR